MELVKETHADSSWTLELHIQQISNSCILLLLLLFWIWKENEPDA